MPKTITSAMRTLLDSGETDLSVIWRITRTDGEAFYFTDSDVDLTFDGNVYKAPQGFERTAISNSADYAVDNVDFTGFFSDDEIESSEVRAGLFDGATLEVSLISRGDPDGRGEIKMRRGRFGEWVITQQGYFTVELRGLAQPYAQQTLDLYSPICRADLGDAQCKFPIKPDLVERDTAYIVGDFVRVETDGWDEVSVANASFEDDGVEVDSGDPISGWTVISGDWDVHSLSGGLGPNSGSFYLEGGTASGEIRQDVDLNAAGVPLALIDAGEAEFRFRVARANSFADDTGQVLVEFLDSGSSVLSTMGDTGDEEITPQDTWVKREFVGVAPANTRFVRIRFFADLVAGGQANAAFDDVNLDYRDDTDPELEGFGVHENRIYECTTAGTTAEVAPTYDTTIGNTTADGTAVFTARDSFMRSPVLVDAVTSQREFVASSDLSGFADGHFKEGVLTWETGNNVGASYEIKSWTESTLTVELWEEARLQVQVGDQFRLHRGCQKRVLEDCRDTFQIPGSTNFADGNVKNFRGEPYVPGGGLTAITPNTGGF